MKRVYRKPHRHKRKKPIFKIRFFWLGILGFFIFAAIFYFLFFSEIFQVKKIIVTGEKKVAKENIELLVGERLENKIFFLKTKSIFAVDLKQTRQDILNAFPQIAEAEVSRGFFDAINVMVMERLGLAHWYQNEDCFLIDSEGIIFEKVVEAEPWQMEIENLTLTEEISLGDSLIDEELLSKVFEIKSKIEENLGIPIVKASLVSEERLNMKTAEHWEIYFNLKGDLDWQITELGLVLEKQISPEKRGELEYIDLRFSRVFYK